tara:strand:- start:2334 stop:3428 length:1095 start_codon:yes stop_codon:yes gene_type:complete
MKIKEDSRTPQNKEVHPDKCSIGDLYKPWYFYQNSVMGSPTDIDQVGLVYDIKRMNLEPSDIPATSYLKIPNKRDIIEYTSKDLIQSISAKGQTVPIVCTKHYTRDAPINVAFLEDPELAKIHCFEGHHRVVSCKALEQKVIADVYHLYHMNTPTDYSKHFNSSYDDTFWSSFQTSEHRKPWFKENEFVEFDKTHKYTQLNSCFDFIKTLNLKLTNGIDVGSAEGAYTFFANSALGIPMSGIDMEPGRIIRGLLMKNKHDKSDIDFKINAWEDADVLYDKYDFAMMLSILHHIDNPATFLKRVSENKQAMIIEARISNNVRSLNSGTMKAINTREYYENMFRDCNLNYKQTSSLGDRAFYVCWR